MATATGIGPVVEEGVLQFLQLHGAESDFRTACELIVRFFPEARSVKVWLLNDPDEDNHTWVVLQLRMPPETSEDETQMRREQFHEQLARMAPRPYHPLSFSIWIDPEAE